MNKQTINAYKSWLYDMVGVNSPDHSYYLLLDSLFSIDYFFLIEFDENRMMDGINLRSEFISSEATDNMKYNIFMSSDTANVLEVLIGIAKRMDFILYDEQESRLIPLFWELIENLGLGEMDDNNFKGNAIVRRVISKWLNRSYTSSGKGNIFPLKKTKYDQRQRETWDQMNEYLLEKYYLA